MKSTQWKLWFIFVFRVRFCSIFSFSLIFSLFSFFHWNVFCCVYSSQFCLISCQADACQSIKIRHQIEINNRTFYTYYTKIDAYINSVGSQKIPNEKQENNSIRVATVFFFVFLFCVNFYFSANSLHLSLCILWPAFFASCVWQYSQSHKIRITSCCRPINANFLFIFFCYVFLSSASIGFSKILQFILWLFCCVFFRLSLQFISIRLYFIDRKPTWPISLFYCLKFDLCVCVCMNRF